MVFLLYLPHPANLVAMGATLTCIPWFVSLVVVQASGSGPVSMGAEAEEWTSTELRRLCGRRYWLAGPRRRHLVDHVPLAGWDIDHVLIGPEGIAVIETKWCSDLWSASDQGRIAAAGRSARADARKLEAILRAVPHRLHLKVTPVVALWPAERSKPAPTDPGGTEVVWGLGLASWWGHQTGTLLRAAEVHSAHEAAVEFVRMRDHYELHKVGSGFLQRLGHRIRLNPNRG